MDPTAKMLRTIILLLRTRTTTITSTAPQHLHPANAGRLHELGTRATLTTMTMARRLPGVKLNAICARSPQPTQST